MLGEGGAPTYRNVSYLIQIFDVGASVTTFQSTQALNLKTKFASLGLIILYAIENINLLLIYYFIERYCTIKFPQLGRLQYFAVKWKLNVT